MCGIAGILHQQSGQPASAQALAAMASALAHRGPDDEGLFLSPSGACGLAARRLSIIDLAGGHQPLSNETGACWVVQNGEIYNYQPLRAELAARGHLFRTQSDTEVIVHAYEEWGEGCLQRLWGMFALAIWDDREQRLLLARDRFGIKPLYHAHAGGQFLFASEMKALLRHPALRPTLDARSLEDLFTVGFAPGPATIWQQVQKLPPASALSIAAPTGARHQWRYWELAYTEDHERREVNQQEAEEEVLALLQDAVRLRLQSDVPVGALLSGGLDSSGIVALMQELSGGRTHTFSIGFQAASHDESAHAQRAAAYLGTQHHVLHFGWEAFDLLPQVVAALDQPQCFPTAAPIWLLYKACHEAGFKVILTGEGSDELLGGYPWFRGNAQAEPLLRLPRRLRQGLFGLPDPGSPEARPRGLLPVSPAAARVLSLSAGAGRLPSPVARYLAWLQVSNTGRRASLFSKQFRDALASSDRPPLLERWQTAASPAIAHLPVVHQDQILERSYRLPDFINHEVDAMSMAHSVEARVPYLDHRLWELLAEWPARLTLDLRRPEKWLLRRVFARPGVRQGNSKQPAARPYLPPEIRTRRKQGLATPHAAWWRRESMPGWLEEALSPDMLKRGGLFQPQTVAEWRARHRAGTGDASALLTGVLNVQLWLLANGFPAW